MPSLILLLLSWSRSSWGHAPILVHSCWDLKVMVPFSARRTQTSRFHSRRARVFETARQLSEPAILQVLTQITVLCMALGGMAKLTGCALYLSLEHFKSSAMHWQSLWHIWTSVTKPKHARSLWFQWLYPIARDWQSSHAPRQTRRMKAFLISMWE